MPNDLQRAVREDHQGYQGQHILLLTWPLLASLALVVTTLAEISWTGILAESSNNVVHLNIMDSNIKYEPTNNIQINLPLIPFAIKTEQEDHPDLVDENDLAAYKSTDNEVISNVENDFENSTNLGYKERYNCAQCGEEFPDPKYVQCHEAIHAPELHCPICNGTYSSVSSLNKHTKKIHEAGKTFPCRKCGETFLNFRQMKEHKRQLHPEIVYNRICSLCNEKFSCRETFMNHQFIHTDMGKQVDESSFATPIDCYLCGEQTSGIKGLFKHQQDHMLMTDEEMEACVRMKKFGCKFYMLKHEKVEFMIAT
ncbi:hypothetical protein NQ318_003358 [Aromia moschata]|uniref:C2H2-type domain-containing protein n=1 Tax=Aromia moschata TaxID=1265417 RepID=A0AAV8YCA0_9CUCU|nr:hypothetical protein NQ318_003358 [Aromia moschata]